MRVHVFKMYPCQENNDFPSDVFLDDNHIDFARSPAHLREIIADWTGYTPLCGIHDGRVLEITGALLQYGTARLWSDGQLEA